MKLSPSDSSQSIRRSALHFFSGTLLSRITGMIRDICMAYVFGARSSIAAFMLAFRFAHFLRRFLGEGALQTAFIPKFEGLRAKNSKEAFLFFSDLNKTLFYFLIVLICACASILCSILWKGALSAANQEVLSLALIMLPSLLFICLFGINASLLQCERSYFIPSSAPVFFNLVWISIIFYIHFFSISNPPIFLSLGIILACMGQWAGTLPSVQKILKDHNVSLWKESSFFPSSVKSMLKPLMLGMVGIVGSQINQLVDGLFARSIDLGGPAILWYATRLQQLPLALFGIALAGAVLPPLSRALKENNIILYKDLLKSALLQTATLMIPLTGIVFAIGLSGTNLLYGRGNFSSQDVIATTYCLWGYGMSLLPSAFLLILAPAYYAKGEYRIPAFTALFAVLLNLIFNSYFILKLNLGILSLAVSTSIISWINLAFLNWKLKHVDLLELLLEKRVVQVSICTLLAVIGTFFFNFSDVYPQELLPRDFFRQLITLSKTSGLFISLFLMSWCLISFQTIAELFSNLKKRYKKELI